MQTEKKLQKLVGQRIGGTLNETDPAEDPAQRGTDEDRNECI